MLISGLVGSYTNKTDSSSHLLMSRSRKQGQLDKTYLINRLITTSRKASNILFRITSNPYWRYSFPHFSACFGVRDNCPLYSEFDVREKRSKQRRNENEVKKKREGKGKNKGAESMWLYTLIRSSILLDVGWYAVYRCTKIRLKPNEEAYEGCTSTREIVSDSLSQPLKCRLV